MSFIMAFIIGGIICALGQILIDLTNMTPANVLVTFVVLGVILTAIGIYEPLVKLAGSGATVPLIGFGYTMAKGTIEAIKEKGLIGALTGGTIAAAAGVASAVFFGFIAALISKPRDKN